MDLEDEQILNLLNAPSDLTDLADPSDPALDILSVTDIALRALNQTSSTETESKSSHNESENGSQEPRSPPSLTASDILIRNTNVELGCPKIKLINSPAEVPVSPESVISDLRSDSILSESIDTSFTGPHVKKVKISANRVREIESPLDLRSPESDRALSPPTRDIEKTPQPRKPPRPIVRREPSPPTREASEAGEASEASKEAARKLRQGKPASTKHSVVTDHGSNVVEPAVIAYEVDVVPTKLGEAQTEMGNTVVEEVVSVDSVQSESAASMTMDHNLSAPEQNSTNLVPETTAPRPISNPETLPEIFTVPENLVDIDELSRSERSTPVEDRTVDTTSSSLGKRAPSRLVQGTRVHGPGCPAGPMTSQRLEMTSRDELLVSQFDSSGKERVVRDVLKKKQAIQSKPTKRFVQPQIIKVRAKDTNNNHASRQKKVEASRQLTADTQEAITAAVAASAAIAVTQPYVKAQQDLDEKMSSVLEKISAVQGAAAGAGGALSEADRGRIQDLEAQLRDLTQKRLDYIERMQQHHMEWQNKMLCARTPCAATRDHYQPVVTPSREVPVTRVTGCNVTRGVTGNGGDVTSRRQYASMTDLELGAQRRMNDQVQNRGKLLEEILAQSSLSRDVLTTPISLSRQSGLDAKPSTPIGRMKIPGISDYVAEKLAKATVGPTPLDGYLRKPTDLIPTSPYPTLAERRRESLDSFGLSHVEAVLETLSRNKECLENNYSTLIKAKNDADVYNVVDAIANESAGAEVARRRRLVDDYISHLSLEVKALVEDDLNREKRQKEMVEQSVLDDKKPVRKQRFGGRVQPRIDSGVRRPEPAPPRGKENVPAKRTAKPPARPPVAPPAVQDESYVTKVYGKAAYQNKRMTVKNPYLHYRNPVSPSNKVQSRPVPTQDVKAIPIKSARTQTAPPVPPAPVAPVQYLPVKGRLIPVAMSLGPPRQGGAKGSTVLRTAPPVAEDKKLKVKVLPSVEIDSESSEVQQEAVERNRLERMVHETRQRQLNDIPESTDTVGAGLTLPGYHPPTPDPYLGPAYPPQGPAHREPRYPIVEDKTAKEMAERLQKQDLLHNKARDWIEQELLARLLLERQQSKEAAQARDPVPHPGTSRDQQSPVEDATAAALNNRGVQMFMDEGLPVNEGLVKKLISDVIKERLRHTLGGRKMTVPTKTTSPRRKGPKKESTAVDASLNVSSINSSPPKIMSPLDADRTARSSVQSESESTNELAAIWGKKPVLTIEEEENSGIQYSKKRDDTPVPSGSEVWEYEDEFPQTPGSEHGNTVSQAPSTPSTPGTTPKPQKVDLPEPEQRTDPDPVRMSANEVRISITSREPSPPTTARSLTSPDKSRSHRSERRKPQMDEMGVQTSLAPSPPASPAPSSLSPSSDTLQTDTYCESISEGEWLISHSEGQAPDVDPVRRTALLQYLREDEPSIAVSDLPQDEHYQGFLNRSVGEFIRPRATSDHPANLVEYLSQHRPPAHPLHELSRPDYPSPVPHHYPSGQRQQLESQKSIGELVLEGGILMEQDDEHILTDDDPLRVSELRPAPSDQRPPTLPHSLDSFPPRPLSLQSTPAVKSSDTAARLDDVATPDDVTAGDGDDVRRQTRARIIQVRSLDEGDDTMRNIGATLASTFDKADLSPRADARTPDQMTVDKARYLAGQTADTDSDPAQDHQHHDLAETLDDNLGEKKNLLRASDALGSSIGGTGQFTITTDSLGEVPQGLLEKPEISGMSDVTDGQQQERQMIVRMPSAGNESETETAEDISEISIS